MKKFRYVFSVFCSSLILTGSVNLSADEGVKTNDEKTFLNAKHYTVKIRTRIKYPFIEDSKTSSLGAGFLIDKSKGLIITNAHVVGHSRSQVSVMFYDGEYIKATKLYVDPVLDFAIIKIPTKHITNNIKEASLDCDSEVFSGQSVGAYGHPWDLSFTSTRGIISGTPYIGYADWIQTDAPINSGNSGGPLIGLRTGKVVGISSASLSGKDVEGLNFALPIKYACNVVDLHKAGVDPSPPNLGLEFFETRDNEPLKVAEVFDSEKSNLFPGDIVSGIVGKDVTIKNPFHLFHYLRGDIKKVTLKVIRNDKQIEVPISIVKMDKVLKRKGLYFSGMFIAPNKYSDRAKSGYSSAWLVHFIDTGSTAESEKIKEWDLLLKIDNKPIGDFDDVYEYIKGKHLDNKKVTLMLKRTSIGSHKMNDYHEVELLVEDEEIIKV